MQIKPPKLWKAFFRWFCRPEFFEELQGDLEERFYRNAQTLGQKKASNIYMREVLKMLRPSVIKKITTQPRLNNIAMFKNYSIVALRSLVRNRLFSSINIIGLAISMAVGLIAISFVTEIYSFDNFHQNRDRLFRVVSNLHRSNGNVTPYATTSIYAGNRLAREFTGFEAVAPLKKGFGGEVLKGETKVSITGIYANNDLFKVLSFQLVSGNPSSALTDPNSVILTESTALKLFDRTDVVGELIEVEEQTPYKITGILKDPPYNSHLKFDAIASLKTLEDKGGWEVTDFGNIWTSYVYVLLPENYDLERIQANLDRLSEEENPRLVYWTLSMELEKFDDIFPTTGKSNQFSVVMPKEKVNSIIVLALIVLFSACFNYTNLSLARSLKRAKEIGVRKVVGAGKGQLFSQFILEAVFVSIFAVVLAYGLFQLIKPEFLKLDFYIERTTSLVLTRSIYLYFFLFAIVVGVFSGLFPSLLMTKFKPVNILKGASSIKTNQGIGVRKILVTIQFALSMGFATLVVMAYQQYKYALNIDLGFETENILNVYTKSNDPEVLKSTFSAIPEVTDISSSSIIPSTGSSMSNFVKYKDPLDSVNAYTLDIDANYLSNMGHRLVAGTGFEKDGIEKRVVVNEKLIKELGFETPQEAIGEQLVYFENQWTVVGVIENFHHGTINEEISSFLFTTGREGQRHSHLNIKLQTDDIVATLNKLDKAWKQIDSEEPFESKFYNEWIERTYADVNASLKTYGLLAVIAICVSILGLLGMAIYTAESKVKELAIRKVLGATLSNLLVLLSRNFIVIFLISACAAIPLAYYVYQETIVPRAVYQNSVGLLELSSGALLIIIIAILTISGQTVKAARSNPAESLRNE